MNSAETPITRLFDVSEGERIGDIEFPGGGSRVLSICSKCGREIRQCSWMHKNKMLPGTKYIQRMVYEFGKGVGNKSLPLYAIRECPEHMPIERKEPDGKKPRKKSRRRKADA